MGDVIGSYCPEVLQVHLLVYISDDHYPFPGHWLSDTLKNRWKRLDIAIQSRNHPYDYHAIAFNFYIPEVAFPIKFQALIYSTEFSRHEEAYSNFVDETFDPMTR